MKKQQQQSVTSLPPSPDDERSSRMLRYGITMGIRTVCVVLAILIPDWWRWIFALGAIILPYIAVVAANNVSNRMSTPVVRPGNLVPVQMQRGDDE